jgi:hypothetical protein
VRPPRFPVLAFLALFGTCGAWAETPVVTIQVNATSQMHPISPNVYGLNHADAVTLDALNSPLNRFGGNRRSRYNWAQNVDSTASDFFFESFPAAPVPGGVADTHVLETRNANAQSMITVPMIDFIAKTDGARNVLCSFSVAKYGPQAGADDEFRPDCGNGIKLDGTFVINQVDDANTANSPAFQQTFVQHLVDTWGLAAAGGVRYYILDNEHAIWHETHRDVHPAGAGTDEIRQKMIDYASTIKSVDPGALVLGPEEFGWTGYFLSGLDIKTCNDLAAATGDFSCFGNPPDRGLHGGIPYVAYLLDQLRAAEVAGGRRLLDVFTLHYYPGASGVFAGGVDPDTQDRRSRTTRSLWDPTYVDETFIAEPVRLVPRMKEWVSAFYPGTPTGVTEYHWGAEGHINGGTTQADVLGIFGREGLDMATLYTDDPLPLTTFFARAFQMYRNYDGQKSTFGDVSVETVASYGGAEPLANHLGAYGALRSADGALTLMVVSKVRTGDIPVQVALAGFAAGETAEVWRFTAAAGGAISRLADIAVAPGGFGQTIPPQSVTLFVIRPRTGTGAPSLALGLNQESFRAGQTMSLTATLAAGAPPPAVDVYILIRLPGGAFFSLTAGGGVVPGIAPAARGIVPVAFAGEVVRFTFTGAEPPGDYMWVGALTVTGTTDVVGTVSMRPFTLGP